MSYESESFRDLLEKRVSLSPAVRILLAVTVILGGIAFFFLGIIFLLQLPNVPPPHPIAVKLLSFVMAFMGACFLWVGSRLIRSSAESSKLLSPLALSRCSLVVGALAVGMLIAAVEAQSLSFLATAVALVAFSYWLFPLERR